MHLLTKPKPFLNLFVLHWLQCDYKQFRAVANFHVQRIHRQKLTSPDYGGNDAQQLVDFISWLVVRFGRSTTINGGTAESIKKIAAAQYCPSLPIQTNKKETTRKNIFLLRYSPVPLCNNLQRGTSSFFLSLSGRTDNGTRGGKWWWKVMVCVHVDFFMSFKVTGSERNE